MLENEIILSTSSQSQSTRNSNKHTNYHRHKIPCSRVRGKYAVKELDAETGLYYYGARYLDPRVSRWLSGDPAMWQGDYLPSAPINDEARRRNGNLPGNGGIFNHVNMHVYHYAANNPVKFIDPDGRMPSAVVGGIIGFVSSTAVEVGGRISTGQSFGDAVRNTFSDSSSRRTIIASTAIETLTSGVSSLAVKGATASIRGAAVMGANTTGSQLAATVAINTVSGAVDAAAKDVATRAITGQEQNLGETALVAGKGAINAFAYSAVTQGVVAVNTNTSRYVYNGVERSVSHPPQWSGTAGVIGESILPLALDATRSLHNGYRNSNE